MLYVQTWWCWDAAVWSCDCWDVRVVYNPLSSLLYHGLMLLLYHSWDSFVRIFYVSVQPWITYWLLLRCSHGLKMLLWKLVILIDVQLCISTYTFGASLLAALSVVLESLTNRCVKFVNGTSIWWPCYWIVGPAVDLHDLSKVHLSTLCFPDLLLGQNSAH